MNIWLVVGNKQYDFVQLIRYATRHKPCQLFGATQDISPELNKSLLNMASLACEDFVLKHMAHPSLSKVMMKYGLPLPLFLKQYSQEVIESLKHRFGKAAMHVETASAHINLSNDFSLSPTQDSTSKIRQQTCMKDNQTLITSVERADALEFCALVNGMEIKRVDGLSLKQDRTFVMGECVHQYLRSGQEHYIDQAIKVVATNDIHQRQLPTYSAQVLTGDSSHGDAGILAMQAALSLSPESTLGDVLYRVGISRQFEPGYFTNRYSRLRNYEHQLELLELCEHLIERNICLDSTFNTSLISHSEQVVDSQIPNQFIQSKLKSYSQIDLSIKEDA